MTTHNHDGFDRVPHVANTGRLRRVAAVAALALIAGAALSSRALAGAEAAAQGDGSVEMTTIRDGKTIRLTMKDDAISAQIDGKDVPQSRIREKGNRVEILDDKGDVLQRFYVDRSSGSGMVLGDEFSDIENLPMGDKLMEDAFKQHQEILRRLQREGFDAQRRGADARRDALRLLNRLQAGGPDNWPEGGLGLQFHGLDAPGNSVLMMSRVENGRKFELEIRNGEASAKIDDQPVDPKNIRKSDAKVELLDDKGQVVATFDLPKVGGGFAGGAGGARGGARNLAQGRAGGAGGGWQRMERDGDPALDLNNLGFAVPPVMVGITMSAAPNDVGVRVDTVIEGLPADKAGVKVGDIIKSVDGSPLANQGDLRTILITKKPGDTIKAIVSRDGKETEVTMTLVAFDAAKLPSARAGARNMPNAQQWNWQAPVERKLEVPDNKDQDWYDDARKRIDKALEEIRSKVNEADREKIKAQAEKALNEAREALSSAKEKAAKAFEEARAEGQAQWRGLFGPDDKVLADKQGQWFVVPQQQNDAMERLTRQLEALQRDLNRLHERLDAMEKPAGR